MKFSNNYTLSSIISCIKNEDALRQGAQYASSMKGIDLIVDTAELMKQADLTENQNTVIMLRWKSGKTLKDTADILGVSPEAVRQSEALAKKKMQAVLDRWGDQ